jgi:hypothetical protein
MKNTNYETQGKGQWITDNIPNHDTFGYATVDGIPSNAASNRTSPLKSSLKKSRSSNTKKELRFEDKPRATMNPSLYDMKDPEDGPVNM